MLTEKVSLFNIEIDPLTMKEAVQVIYGWIAAKDKCRYVVTPNTDSIVLLKRQNDLLRAYQGASLILADGNPLVWASRLLGKPLPEVVPGSDLIPALFAAAKNKDALRVFLMGAAPGVAERASAFIRARWPTVTICGIYSPAIGFESDEKECSHMVSLIATGTPDIVVLGLGAPKQELWIEKHHERIQASVVLCVGATIDFLAGEKKRAPVWMRKFCLEWLFRMLCEPRRLFLRYLRAAWVFPQLLIEELMGKA
jgi:N-acetylglucosaminyldiphosphoundecaprenol N-acetyl-beta-D-mannosaminyltransferase